MYVGPHVQIQRGEEEHTSPFLENHVAIGFFRNTGTDTPQEANGPNGFKCCLREVCASFCEIC